MPRGSINISMPRGSININMPRGSININMPRGKYQYKYAKRQRSSSTAVDGKMSKFCGVCTYSTVLPNGKKCLLF